MRVFYVVCFGVDFEDRLIVLLFGRFLSWMFSKWMVVVRFVMVFLNFLVFDNEFKLWFKVCFNLMIFLVVLSVCLRIFDWWVIFDWWFESCFVELLILICSCFYWWLVVCLDELCVCFKWLVKLFSVLLSIVVSFFWICLLVVSVVWFYDFCVCFMFDC